MGMRRMTIGGMAIGVSSRVGTISIGNWGLFRRGKRNLELRSVACL